MLEILDLDTSVLEEKIRNLECPFCDYKANSVVGYIWHVTRKHPLTKCPVCGQKGKNIVQHLAKQKDRKHQLLWAVYGSYKRGGHRRSRRLMEIRNELWGVVGATQI